MAEIVLGPGARCCDDADCGICAAPASDPVVDVDFDDEEECE